MGRLAVSQNERLLLHLLELDKHRDDPEVPMGSSQEGIAEGLGIQVHSASRTLSTIEGEGLVFDRLAHVRGAPRRRRAYFLTEKGRAAAQSIRTDISKRMVVVEHAGKAQELSVEDALRRLTSLTGTCPSFLELVDSARASDVIRTEVFSVPCVVEEVERVERSHGRPSTGTFFGRDAERKGALDALAKNDVGVLLVWGMPGIGKSAFASKLFEELSGKSSLFWYTLREWDTESSFLSALAEFLSSCGKSETLSALRLGADPAGLFVPVTNDLSGLRAVLFIDDVHKAKGGVQSLLEVLVESVRSSRTGKAVLLGRAIPAFFSKTATGNFAVELSGLDREAAWRLAQSLSAKDSSTIVTQSHGHPLLLTLMARSGGGSSSGDVVSFIDREVYSSLPERERDTLELLSIFRHPVRIDSVRGIEYESIARLRDRALVVDHQDGVWTHDLLREFFSSRLGKSRRESLHDRAAEYCEGHAGVEWKLETLHHYVEAGNGEAARRIAVANAQDLAREFPEEALELLSRIQMDSAGARERAELLFLRGQLEESLRFQEDALAHFGESLSLLSGVGDSDKRAIVLETVAKLQGQVQRWSESLSAHERALRIYEQSGDVEGQAREWINIGGVHRKRGDHRRAREAYGKALLLASKAEDRPAQAACMNNLALLDWDEGRISDAETRLKESIRLAHTVKDYAGEARGLENMADLMRAQMKLAESVSFLQESSEAFRRAGEPVESKRVYGICASVLADAGRFSEAVEVCRHALENPDLRRRRGLFQRSARYDSGDASVAAALVDILRQSGDLKGSRRELDRYAEIASSLQDPDLIARGKLMLALLNERSGDLAGAAAALGVAESILKNAGNSEGLIAVHMRTGIVEEKLGNEDAASRHYEEAAHLADLVGDRHARAMAEENIDSVRKGK